MDLVNKVGWGEETFSEGVGVRWKKWGGEEKEILSAPPLLSLPQLSTGQTSNYIPNMAASKTWFIEHSVPK